MVQHGPPVLIIDDDDDAHYFLRRNLVRAGIEERLHVATSAFTGIEYLEKCAEGEYAMPAMIFLDVHMPLVDGFAVLQWLRQRQLLGRTTVAMMSTSDAPTDVSRALSLGAHTYLNKNVSPEVLGPIVKAAMALARRHLPTK